MSLVPRILLVEDDRRDVELIHEALSSRHLANEVVVARDGSDALDYLRRKGAHRLRTPGNPALVILDLKLPLASGLEILRIIRADEALQLIPVVVLTSSAEEADIVRCYRSGANGYVVKPLDFKEFVSVVASLGSFWAVVNQPPPTPTVS